MSESTPVKNEWTRLKPWLELVGAWVLFPPALGRMVQGMSHSHAAGAIAMGFGWAALALGEVVSRVPESRKPGRVLTAATRAFLLIPLLAFGAYLVIIGRWGWPAAGCALVAVSLIRQPHPPANWERLDRASTTRLLNEPLANRRHPR